MSNDGLFLPVQLR